MIGGAVELEPSTHICFGVLDQESLVTDWSAHKVAKIVLPCTILCISFRQRANLTARHCMGCTSFTKGTSHRMRAYHTRQTWPPGGQGADCKGQRGCNGPESLLPSPSRSICADSSLLLCGQQPPLSPRKGSNRMDYGGTASAAKDWPFFIQKTVRSSVGRGTDTSERRQAC